jgi:MFS family permease
MVGAAVAIIWAPPPAAAQDSQAASQQQVSLEQALARPGGELAGITVPEAAAFARGDRTIANGTTIKGPLAVVGTVRVNGTVDGDVFSFSGDIVVPAGGHITGSAIAISGRVLAEGGAIDGDIRSLNGVLGPVEAPSPVLSTKDQVSLTAGWAVVALLVGIGVLVFGGRTLDAVAETVDRKFGRSFLVGIAATLGFAPVLALLVLGLTLTILGILLVPFAIVAYALAVIGLVALGFLAAARAAGASFARGTYAGARGASLRALVYGLGLFVGVWMIAAVLTPFESIAAAARVLAVAVTWAAATVGLGATFISRAGKRPVEEQRDPELERAHAAARRALEEAAVAPAAPPPPEWQTPTPVSGVVAARRSVPTSSKAP